MRLKVYLRLLSLVVVFLLLQKLVIAQGTSERIETGTDLYDLAWSPDSSIVAVASGNGIIILNSNLQVLTTLTDHVGAVTAVEWNPEGSRLISGGGLGDNSVKVWERRVDNTFVSTQTIPLPVQRIAELTWSPDGSTVVALGVKDVEGTFDLQGILYRFDVTNWAPQQVLNQNIASARGVKLTISWDPTSTYIVSGGETLCYPEIETCPSDRISGGFVVNAFTGAILFTISDEFANHATLWSPQTSEIISSLSTGVALYDSLTGNYIETLPDTFASTMGIDPSGSYLATGLSFGQINVFNISTREEVIEFQAEDELWQIAWHPDRTSLLSASRSGVIEQWSLPPSSTISVMSIVLGNATIDTDTRTLSTSIIETIDISSNEIFIRANTNPSTVASVVFRVDGNVVATDNSAPYTIAGENGSDILPWNIALGTHTIVATPYSGADGTGDAGTPLTVQVNIVDNPPPPGISVTSMTLINADTDTDTRTLNATDTIDLATNGISIRANTNPATVGSVVFSLNGNTNYRTENGAPYAIYTNTNSGQYEPWNITPGMYTLTATPYSGSSGSGTAGTPLTVNLNIVDSSQSGIAVTSLTLINADTDTEIRTLTATESIDITNNTISIRANTTPSTVGSVVFSLNGNIIQTETIAPYAIAGDQSSGTDYTPWTVSPGTYQLVVTPYDGTGGTGNAGTPFTVDLTIVNNNSQTCTPTGGLVQEAEDGILAGNFVVGTDAIASGGEYVHVPNGMGSSYSPGSSSNVRFCFPVDDAGTYRLRAWYFSGDGGADSFYVDYNGAAIAWYTEINTIYALGYVREPSQSTNSAYEYTLSEGNQQFIFALREDGARLDKVELVNVESGETVLYRVDSGASSAYTDTLGNVWSADSNFTGGQGNSYTATILSTIEDTLYTTERSQPNNVGFSYSFPVSNGTYTVRLHFAEIWFTGSSGQGTIDSPSAQRRIFDVQLEGVNVLDEFHIVSETLQPRVAHVEEFSVNVTDGSLDITFPPATTDNPTVAAIEIVQGGQ